MAFLLSLHVVLSQLFSLPSMEGDALVLDALKMDVGCCVIALITQAGTMPFYFVLIA